MYRHIIFDLDGTLLDTLGDLTAVGNRLCRAHGWPEHSREALRPFIGGSLGQFIRHLVPPHEAALRQAAEAEFSHLYTACNPGLARPFPGLLPLLQRLGRAGVVTAVLTNTEDGAARRLMQTHYGSLVPFVAGARPGIPPKPDPTLLGSLLDSLGADRAAALFVGDTPVDVQTAHGAGLPCCGAGWGYGTAEELERAGADFMAAAPEELERLIFSGPSDNH